MYRSRAIMRLAAFFLATLILVPACTFSFRPVESIPTVDPNATNETKALFMNLWLEAHSSHTLFGHEDDTLYGIGWRGDPGGSDVRAVTGSYPAVYGWDVGQIELGGTDTLDGVSFDAMRAGIIAAYRRGGVNTISWHMTNPVNGNLYNDVRGSAVHKILTDPTYTAKYHQWLDRFADFALSLRSGPTPWNPNDHLVPVIFRPFHEHNTGAFWWGSGPAPFPSEADYIALWRMTVQYLRDVRGVHNLLYAYSPDTLLMRRADNTTGRYANFAAFRNAYLDGYPGDAFVDVFGLDDYNDTGNRRQPGFEESLQYLTQLANDRSDIKLPALTETGVKEIPDAQWWTNSLLPVIRAARHGSDEQVAWALVWRNGDLTEYYAPFPGQASAADFRTFAASRFIWLQDDISVNLYAWPPD